MQGRTGFAFWLLVMTAVALPSCQQIINYPAPSIVSLSPNNIAAGQPPFTLTVTGYNFTPATAILWNGGPLTDGIFVTQNIMTAVIPASFIQNPGSISVTVETPQPGGGTAQPALTFTINPTTSAVPLISSINPTSVLAGSAAPTINVYGTNFTSLSTVTVNGGNRATNYFSPSYLSATLNSSDDSSSGVLQIAVVSPPPGGGSSNPMSLTVTNPVPSISSITPAGTLAGAAPPTLTVAGSAFVPNSYIAINGVARPTVFAGNASVSTALTAGDLSVAGINQVQVVNPTPGGGTSNTLSFSINPSTTVGLPVLVDLGPYGVVANEGECGSECTNGNSDFADRRAVHQLEWRIRRVRVDFHEPPDGTDEQHDRSLPPGHLLDPGDFLRAEHVDRQCALERRHSQWAELGAFAR